MLLCVFSALVFAGLPHQPNEATPAGQYDDPVEQGEYLVNIFRCVTCHPPNLAEYAAEELTKEQTRVLALFPHEALNREMWMAGERAFSFAQLVRLLHLISPMMKRIGLIGQTTKLTMRHAACVGEAVVYNLTHRTKTLRIQVYPPPARR